MLNDKDKSIIIALAIGDGYINPRGGIQIKHSIKQKEYLEYKAKLLHSVCGGKDIKIYEYQDTNPKFKEADYTYCSIAKQSKNFKLIRELLYPNGKKYISNEILNSLTDEGIAIWWMDDGCLYKCIDKKRNNRVNWKLDWSTYVSVEEAIEIIKFFQLRWNMTWKIRYTSRFEETGYVCLQCGAVEGRKFLDKIRPYIKKVKVMEYKALDI